MPAEGLAELLYAARKALRRSIFPLSASGWCERAERLLSDRIDGVLAPPGPARLDVHLRNCERCVQHERRLFQARETLVRDFIDTHPESVGAGPAERPAAVAALRVVEPVVVVHEGPTLVVAGFSGFTSQPDNGELPIPSFAGPGGQVQIVVEAPHLPDADELPEDPPLDADVPPAEPGDATPSEHDAEEAEPPVEDSEASVALAAAASLINPANVVWGTLTVISVGLAIFALVITVLALTGLERIF
ncbi:MAG: hypothetical protein QOJ29_1971 [Thermoleophilaceae bacterium]|nr:hypothetical protein [Thermoleophilaceae bacterium]